MLGPLRSGRQATRHRVLSVPLGILQRSFSVRACACVCQLMQCEWMREDRWNWEAAQEQEQELGFMSDVLALALAWLQPGSRRSSSGRWRLHFISKRFVFLSTSHHIAAGSTARKAAS